MAIPILFELNEELVRLFAAGSRLAFGDPRLKKFVAPLLKYGEKAPVFLKLAEQLQNLIETDAVSSAQKLIESESLLLSVLSTQGDTFQKSGDIPETSKHSDYIASTDIGYRELAPVIEALTTTGGGRMEIIQNAFSKGLFRDPRLYRVSIGALGDKYGEISEFMANKVLPSMGSGVFSYLFEGYDVKGGASDGRRLAVMHSLKGEYMLDLAEDAAENGSAVVKAEAVKIMAFYPRYEDTLFSMLGENKAVRDEVMKALVKMDSRRGVDKIMEIYKTSKAETMVDALLSGEGEYISEKLLDLAFNHYEVLKNAGATAKDAEKLKFDLAALENKTTDKAVDFLKTMLSEPYLAEAEKLFSKENKASYYYKTLEENALEILYHSKKADDYIWDMFNDSRGGIVNKIFKRKKNEFPKTLYRYAFYIGSKKLSPDDFYNMFFKSGLYKEISKLDYRVFANVFLKNENSPPFSGKIARYFAEQIGDHSHINLALEIVSQNDSGTLDFIADYIKTILKKSTYYYNSFEIMKKFGEFYHHSFKELFELYCQKYKNNSSDIEYLRQFLKK